MGDEKQKAWWQRRRWWATGSLLLMALILADVVAAFMLPPRMASHIPGATVGDQLKAEADLRSAILSLLGALTPLVALIAGVAALLNFQETRRQNRVSLDITSRGQVTERFSKAIEQLGSAELDVRIGGIYALEQIARDSPKTSDSPRTSDSLHWPVMEILTAFIRDHPPELKKVDYQLLEQVEQRQKEVQQRRQPLYQPDQQTLVDLRHKESNLKVAADVQAALSVLGRRELTKDLGRLRLEGSDLRQADLVDANFEGADLEGVDLRGAVLTGALLKGASLLNANLLGVDLSTTRDLTQDQLDSAKCDSGTKPPPGLTVNTGQANETN
jgi:hypothetical protein